jgi:hypothetical protein
MRARILAVVILLFSVSSPLIQAQVVVTDDANTSSSLPTKNFGGSIALLVGCGSNSYLKFGLANLGSGITSSNVSKATLVLYTDFVLTSGTMDVYQVSGPWSEGSITYNNAPALGTKLFSAVSITKAGFLSLDLTSTVQSWLNGTLPNNGIALVPTSGSPISVSFDSKENILTSHVADLALMLISAGPQGQQGQTGATGPAGPIGPIGPNGAPGSAGAQGIQGIAGPIGQTGATGPQGPTGTGFNFRTAFDNSVSYATNDVVTFNGSSYVATASNAGPNNATPDSNTTAWSLMAAQGAAGAAGAAGAPGQQGPQGPPGSAGATGAQGPVGATGPQGAPGMMGATGMTGDTGPQGPAGTNGTGFNFRTAFDNSALYAANDVVTYNGSSYVATAATSGPNNPTPDTNPAAWSIIAAQGAAGAAGTAGAQGQPGPQGPPGSPGAAGATGTQGPAGPQGTQGSSGPAGPTGPAGPQGLPGGVSLIQSKAALLRWYRQDFAVGSNPVAVAFDGTNIWIANQGSNNVTELRASDGSSVGSFPVGASPADIAFDGANIWVTNYSDNNVTKLRASDGSTVGTFAAGLGPAGIAFDGANIWMTNGDGNVTKLRASDGFKIGTFPLATGAFIHPSGIAFDGANIWVTSSTALWKLRATDGAVLLSIPATSQGIAFDGTNIWVTDNFQVPNSSVLKYSPSGNNLGDFTVGHSPRRIAFDGSNVWVTNENDGTVTKLRAIDGVNLGTFPVGLTPQGIAFDGVNIWVANNGSNTVSKF